MLSFSYNFRVVVPYVIQKLYLADNYTYTYPFTSDDERLAPQKTEFNDFSYSYTYTVQNK
jgi:hypothetical protein